MTFAAGTTLGVYEILSPLGVGGMGEVRSSQVGVRCEAVRLIWCIVIHIARWI